MKATQTLLEKIAAPVLEAGRKGNLKQAMGRIDLHPTAAGEAAFRTLAGLAPWLETHQPPETAAAQTLLAHITNPKHPDFQTCGKQRRDLVEAGLLALALLRSPKRLWEDMDEETRKNIIQRLEGSRRIVPSFNNWILFSAAVEATLLRLKGRGNTRLIQRTIQTCQSWYVGDGLFSDGPAFRHDYYHSFVTIPFLLEISEAIGFKTREIQTQAQAAARVQESLISPEGSFPIMGRSASYRTAAFHTLSTICLKSLLPEELNPQATQAALAAVATRVFTPECFDTDGWLQIGITGQQTQVADYYTNRGSLYFCTLGFAHLGIGAGSQFWETPQQGWTQQRLWGGENIPSPQNPPEEKTPLAKTQEKLRYWKRKLLTSLRGGPTQ